MRLEKVTWVMIAAGVGYIVLTLATGSQSFNDGTEAPFGLLLRCFGAVPYFFFAAVVEFLARIARALEGAADAIDKA